MTVKILELVDQQLYQGQAIENVFHFVDVDGVADPHAFLPVYVSDVLPLVRQMQHTGCQHTNIRWRLVYPATTLMLDYATGLPVAGADANTPAPSTSALSFKWLLSNPTVVLSGGFAGHIRRGGARIGGVCDTAFVGNAVESAHITLGRAWSEEMLSPGADAWQLAVVSFLIGNHVRGGPPRLRSETATSYTIVGSSTDPAPSTQNTRKFLRGIAS